MLIKMRNLPVSTLGLFLLLCLPMPAHAEEKPLWEISLGIIGLNTPDYRGSDHRTSYFLPFPYIEYRGKYLTIDDEGARVGIASDKRIKFDFSLAIGPPTKSDENDIRAGMPDLDPTIEIGPQIQILLSEDTVKRKKWRIVLPLRAAFTLNPDNIEHIGNVFAPHVQTDFFTRSNWDIGIAFGPIYATEEYHEYFYGVPQGFDTANRPLYDAKSGYSGSRLTISAQKKFPKYWLVAFARYDTLSGAVFEDSPLVRKDHSFMFGAGISWHIWKSKRMVDR